MPYRYLSIPAGLHFIEDNAFPKNDTFTVFAAEGSEAIEYAKKNGIRYRIDSSKAPDSDEIPEEETPGDLFEYETNETGISIIGYTGTGSNLNIPSYIDGKKVTGITRISSGSYKRDELRAIKLPQGVTYIFNGAFVNCTRLKKIILPDSMEKIGMGAFSGCTALESVYLPDNISGIEDRAFETSVLIIGKRGSAAENYAIEKHMRFCDVNTDEISDYRIYPTDMSVYYTPGIDLTGWFIQFLAVYSPPEATITDIIWESSDTSVATVENGTARPVGNGEAVISASLSDGRVKVSYKISVSMENASIENSTSPINVISPPEYVYSSYISDMSTTLAYKKTSVGKTDLKWISSDEDIAVVDENGRVTAVGSGTVIISVLEEDKVILKFEVTVDSTGSTNTPVKADTGDGKQDSSDKIETVKKNPSESKSYSQTKASAGTRAEKRASVLNSSVSTAAAGTVSTAVKGTVDIPATGEHDILLFLFLAVSLLSSVIVFLAAQRSRIK